MQHELTPTEIQRYSRQLILSAWSGAHQEALKQERVLISSELSSTLYYLAAAGVGEIVVFGANGRVREHAQKLNPDVRILEHEPKSAPSQFSALISLSTDPLPPCLTPLVFVVQRNGQVTEFKSREDCAHCPKAHISAPSQDPRERIRMLQGGVSAALTFLHRGLTVSPPASVR